MPNQIDVSFKVQDNGLKAYMDQMHRKQKEISDTAIHQALEEGKTGKDYLRIIKEQIEAIERRNKAETAGGRLDVLHNRNKGMAQATSAYWNKMNEMESKRGKEGYTPEFISNVEDLAEGRFKENKKKVKVKYDEDRHSLQEREHQSKLQTILAREQIETLKNTAKDNVKAIMNGDKKLSDVMQSAQTDDEKLVAKMTAEGVKEEKKNKHRDSVFGGHGVLTSILEFDAVRSLAGNVMKLGQSKNGFDMIGSAGSVIGEVAGTLIGAAVVGALTDGVGAMAGAAGGAEAGRMLFGGIGEFEQRKAIERQQYFKARNRLTAITGNESPNSINSERVGVDLKTFLGLQSQYARRIGYAAGSDRLTANAIYAEKGYGVDQGTSANIVEMMRSSRERDRNLSDLIGGVLKQGKGSIFKNGDTTFLNEFLGKFATLQKELLKEQTHVATGGTMDILKKFNGVGGEYALRDPRSMGLINTINNSLKNPTSDITKAISFYALRSQHPNMGIADLIEEQQKGLGSNGYFKSVMKYVTSMGGNEQFKRLNVAGAFGLGDQQKFADDLLRAWEGGKFKGVNSDKELSAKIDMMKRAEDLTTPMERNEALVNNGMLTDKSVHALVDAFTTAVQYSLSGAVIEMKDGNKIKLNSTMKMNVAHTAGDLQRIMTKKEYYQIEPHK